MSDISADSLLMSSFRKIGMESVAWALRRLHCPVDNEALVLEVGSGGNPYARANVLLDAYDSTRERHWVPLVTDRPIVLGFAEHLPFKDKCFDFVIDSHVLEHSSHSERFLSELQRVARAGYIEVPDAFMERINPYKDHRLEVTERSGKLIIRKKIAWIVDSDTVDLYEHNVKPFLTKELMAARPFAFHVRYFWEDRIDFHVVNPDDDASWPPVESSSDYVPLIQKSAGLKNGVLKYLRSMLSQNKRNKSIDLIELLSCPNCQSQVLLQGQETVSCSNCRETYPVKNGVPVMYKSDSAQKE